MFKISGKGLRAALVLAAALVASNSVQAAPFSAYEILVDAPPYDAGAPSVTRTYWSSLGGAPVTSPATSANVDNDFGVVNFESVGYWHDLSFLMPATFSSATLTLEAWGNLGGNDHLVVETVDLGTLLNASLGSGLFSTTVFSGAIDLALLNDDGKIRLVLQKNVDAGFPGSLNAFSLYSSRLDVEGDTVPEPMSLMLVGAGLIAGAARLRRRK